MNHEHETHLAEKIASASAELYHAILETTSIGIITVDADDLVVYVNREACRMWGYDPAELIGNPITLLLPTLAEHTADHPDPPAIMRTIAGENLDVEGRSREGHRIRAALSVRETRLGDAVLYTAALQDISERLQYEEALIEARERAEEMTRIRTALLTNIGHEIRTPLTGIRGFAKVLMEESEGNQREFAQLIEQNSHRLLDTLNSVLEMVRLESSVPRSPASTFDLVEVLRSVAAIMAPAVAAKSVRFTVEASHTQISVHTDQDSVYSILYNLLGNAAKFTHRGFIRASLDASAQGIEIVVEDTGIGVSEDFLPRLFEDFSQESTGLTRDFEGSGLGLALTRRAVHSLDGQISVRSKQGKGSRFTVTLPLPGEAEGSAASYRIV